MKVHLQIQVQLIRLQTALDLAKVALLTLVQVNLLQDLKDQVIVDHLTQTRMICHLEIALLLMLSLNQVTQKTQIPGIPLLMKIQYQNVL